jgi:hypothetical protein
MAYADDVNLLEDTKHRTWAAASNNVGLEVNPKKTKYVLLSRHQNAGQNLDIKTESRSFENVGEFKYLGLTVSNQNLINEESKSILNSGNAWYHSVENLSSFRLLSMLGSSCVHNWLPLEKGSTSWS